KILSFTEAAGGKPGVARRHAMAFSLGVVATFVALAALLIGLRALGQAVGWGFQLQSPVFVATMALLFVLIGLNLFGVFEAGASLTQLGSAGNGKQGGYRSSFMTGVMAVVVATPCTAPFMGSAVGFTLGSSAWEMLLVFAALGVGMAVPYLVLASSDRLLTMLPRPGAWLQTFKQLLGFPMFLTAAWLVWVLALQTDAEGVLMLLLAAICLGFSAWVYGRWQFELRPKGARSTPAWLLAAALSVVACVVLVSRLPVVADAAASSASAGAVVGKAAPACVPGPDGRMPAECVGWQPWSPERVAAARAAGQPVFVNFTAAWCLTCQVNKRVALQRPEVMKMFGERKVLLLEADWTRRDPKISAELARHGRNSVPFYLFYDGRSDKPRQLPELLTVDVVRDALAS
ncbi:MAG: thioredoxin family protein, partial [Lautropia sp.]|nr:thioredoxin family protein [Lautropia sp.]